MDSFGWIEGLGNNLRYAARRLWRSPGFTTVAILTLALGIGANVPAFTVVRVVLLNPPPYPHPERLVRIYDALGGSDGRDVGMSAPQENRVNAFQVVQGTLYPVLVRLELQCRIKGKWDTTENEREAKTTPSPKPDQRRSGRKPSAGANYPVWWRRC
jgi:hypothetical protein